MLVLLTDAPAAFALFPPIHIVPVGAEVDHDNQYTLLFWPKIVYGP